LKKGIGEAQNKAGGEGARTCKTGQLGCVGGEIRRLSKESGSRAALDMRIFHCLPERKCLRRNYSNLSAGRPFGGEWVGLFSRENYLHMFKGWAQKDREGMPDGSRTQKNTKTREGRCSSPSRSPTAKPCQGRWCAIKDTPDCETSR